jgi:hypothetical protein
MGTIILRTSNELDAFLLNKRAKLKEKDIEMKGNSNVAIYLLEELMRKGKND